MSLSHSFHRQAKFELTRILPCTTIRRLYIRPSVLSHYKPNSPIRICLRNFSPPIHQRAIQSKVCIFHPDGQVDRNSCRSRVIRHPICIPIPRIGCRCSL
ncbi:hypothetical protein PENTCL1PPCAC_7674 [Pristionchus entomophagus]|uniref:Uncharacterized protein n=1 Tax=Pristionchus entomophagus TaxID=358040 RepID=A0AAV5SVV7_9BILA|nr:hypothetical protein PENTCL1PPCAC_7674 [Pristionchus entomophagus]